MQSMLFLNYWLTPGTDWSSNPLYLLKYYRRGHSQATKHCLQKKLPSLETDNKVTHREHCFFNSKQSSGRILRTATEVKKNSYEYAVIHLRNYVGISEARLYQPTLCCKSKKTTLHSVFPLPALFWIRMLLVVQNGAWSSRRYVFTKKQICL